MNLPPYIYGHEAGPNEKVWTEAAVRKAVAAAVPDELKKEAGVLAGILSGMCEGGYIDIETLYTDDQADGDAFVKRAAEVLAMIAAAPGGER